MCGLRRKYYYQVENDGCDGVEWLKLCLDTKPGAWREIRFWFELELFSSL